MRIDLTPEQKHAFKTWLQVAGALAFGAAAFITVIWLAVKFFKIFAILAGIALFMMVTIGVTSDILRDERKNGGK